MQGIKQMKPLSIYWTHDELLTTITGNFHYCTQFTDMSLVEDENGKLVEEPIKLILEDIPNLFKPKMKTICQKWITTNFVIRSEISWRYHKLLCKLIMFLIPKPTIKLITNLYDLRIETVEIMELLEHMTLEARHKRRQHQF